MNVTIVENSVMLSKKGMKDIKKAIIQLEHDRVKAIRALRELDKTYGRDERMERIEKLSQLEAIESDILDKKMTLASAKLLPSRGNRLKVAIGSVVELIDKSGRLFRYKIVDSIEANPSDGRISYLSPLGKSLLGKTIKDVVEWGNGLKQNRLQLVHIA